MTSTVWDRQSITSVLLANDLQLEKAIVALNGRQTPDEQDANHTKHDNTVGWNQPDASKMGYYSRWILSGRRLSGKHLADARARILKYGRQLEEIAQERRTVQRTAAPTVAHAVSQRPRSPQFGITMLSSRGAGTTR